MDALFAFDNAVERLLEMAPIELSDALPEQLATLRFLFESEFDVFSSCERSIERMARALEAAEMNADVNAPGSRSSRAM
jgi:hypothetical protein